MSLGNGGVPQLGGTRQVVIVERRILTPASVEVREGGATVPGCDRHLEVIDIIKGTMYLVPITWQQSDKIIKELQLP